MHYNYLWKWNWNSLNLHSPRHAYYFLFCFYCTFIVQLAFEAEKCAGSCINWKLNRMNCVCELSYQRAKEQCVFFRNVSCVVNSVIKSALIQCRTKLTVHKLLDEFNFFCNFQLHSTIETQEAKRIILAQNS